MKILVIRLSSIGDVLLTTPVLRALKQQLPSATVHLLTKKGCAALMQHNVHLDAVVPLGDSVDATVDALRKEAYDCVVDLHNNHRSRRIRRALGLKRYVYRKENLHKFLFVWTKHNLMSGRHVVDRYYDAVRPLGVTPDGEGLECTLDGALQGNDWLRHSVGGFPVADLVAKPYVAIACGAQHATKQIPLEGLARLCEAMAHPVILLGDGKDRLRVGDEAHPWGNHVVNLCGTTSLEESAALIRDAAVVITPDSAMLHVAAAFRRPTLAVWGATDPAFGFSSFQCEHHDYLVAPLRCHPCSRMGSEHCRHGHFNCMRRHDWTAIAHSADGIIEASTAMHT